MEKCLFGEQSLEKWKVGRLEGWKVGRLERWKVGRLEGWKVGELEGWKVGGLEGWKVGELEGLGCTLQSLSWGGITIGDDVAILSKEVFN